VVVLMSLLAPRRRWALLIRYVAGLLRAVIGANTHVDGNVDGIVGGIRGLWGRLRAVEGAPTGVTRVVLEYVKKRI
jgi:hypothetical protein